VAVLSYAQLEGYWQAAGGDPQLSETMAAIALAESGGNPSALNPVDNHGKQSSFGLWQISNGTHAPPAINWYDPRVNAGLAVGKLRSQGLQAWGTYTSGAYRQFLQSGVVAEPPAAAAPDAPPPTQTRGARPPKATLEIADTPAPAPGTAAIKTDPMESWNLLVNQLFYWMPNGLNRSRAARAGMRALRR
jgi:hypothetical protein